jgi:mannose-P-dolichol utilization defect protein 1
MANSVPFSVYGETLIIMCQNFIIILLIWSYNKEVSIIQKAFVASLFGAYAYALFTPGTLTADHWQLIQGSGIATGLLSRLPQIYTIFAESSTGQLSLITQTLQAVGGLARLATVMFESDDFLF